MKAETLDRSALDVNQAGIIILSIAGFITNHFIPVGIVAVVLLLGTVDRRLALFKQTYVHFLKPVKLIKPDLVQDFRAPHEFAQLLGGLFLLAATIFLYFGWRVTGWSLTWLVILLAATNLFFGFCAGCFVYFQLRKFGLSWFDPTHGSEGLHGTRT